MKYDKFTKKEIWDILDLVQSTVACEDRADLRTLLIKIMKLVGGERSAGIIGSWTGEGFTRTPMIVNAGCREEFLKIYAERRLDKVDPALLLTMKKPGAHRLEDTLMHPGGEEFRRISRLDDFALTHGISGGLYDKTTGAGSMFILPAPPKTFDEHHLAIVDIITPFVHEALERVFNNSRRPVTTPLTVREREVAKWVKEGKTNWEISMILKISESTVNFHVKNILTKLNAVNRAHAAAIAAELSLVC
jgi:DNA-binding CsgD family transcriptional regulator